MPSSLLFSEKSDLCLRQPSNYRPMPDLDILHSARQACLQFWSLVKSHLGLTLVYPTDDQSPYKLQIIIILSLSLWCSSGFGSLTSSLYCLHVCPVSRIISAREVVRCLLANDPQLQIALPPSNYSDGISRLEYYLTFLAWLVFAELIGFPKTDVILLGTRHWLASFKLIMFLLSQSRTLLFLLAHTSWLLASSSILLYVSRINFARSVGPKSAASGSLTAQTLGFIWWPRQDYSVDTSLLESRPRQFSRVQDFSSPSCLFSAFTMLSRSRVVLRPTCICSALDWASQVHTL